MSVSNTKDSLSSESSEVPCQIIREAKEIFNWRFNLPSFFEAVTGFKPYPYQVDFLKKMVNLKNQYAIISAARGCLEENTPIQLANGLVKKIKDVKPGEFILSFDIEKKKLVPRKVEEVIYQGQDLVYEVCSSKLKGNKIYVTEDHPILDSNFEFREAKQFTVDNWRTSNFKSVFIEEFDTGQEFLSDDLIKLLAFLIAEGHYGKGQSPKVTNNNLKYLKEIERIARNNFSLEPKYYKKERGFDLVLSRSTKSGRSPIISWLRELKIYGQSKEKKELPEIIFRSSNRQIRLFLNWFMKGDGNVDRRGNSVEITLYAGLSKKLAEDLKFLLTRLGIYSNISKRKRKGKWNYIVRFSQEWKYQRLFHPSKKSFSFQNTRIRKPIGVRKIYDLRVEGLHNFLANGFIVHNTGKTICLAVLALWYVFVLPLTHPGTPMKVVILAGSERQAKICYGYIINFIAKFPFLQTALAKEPTQEEILFMDGSYIRPLTSSEKSIRGPHPDLLIVDEACLLPGTRILTDNDLVKIENIKPGDKVLTSTGYFQKVKRTFRREYNGPIIKIKLPGNYQEIGLTPNHPVLALKRKYKNISYQKQKMDSPSWIPARNLEKGDLIFQAIPKIKTEVFKRIITKTPRTKLVLKPDKDLFRLVGFYLAEGSSNKDKLFFSFHTNEKKEQNEVKEMLNRILGKQRVYLSPCPRNTTNVIVSSRALRKFLRTEFGNNSKTKHLSSRFWNSGLSSLDNIFDTLFIGDGYSGKLEELHLKSSKLITQFYLYLTAKKLLPGIYKDKNKDSWKVYYSKASSRHKRFVYKNFIVAPVKRIRWEKYEGLVYNLEVERDPSYSLPSMTVHNCQTKDELLTAAMPMISTSKYPRLVLSSTPDKYFSLFVNIYSKPKDYPQFLRFNWSAEKCPLISKKFLQSQKALVDRGSYIVEYLGLPYSFTGKVFPLENLKSCVRYRNLKDTGYPKFAGVDFGYYPAPTVLVIVEREEDEKTKKIFWKVLHTEEFLKQKFEDVLDKIELITKSYGVSKIYADSQDIGECQRLASRGLPVYPVKFRSQKAAMISNLRALVENERLKIDGEKDYPLVAQMRDYRYDSTKNDDYVDALMQAVKEGSQRVPSKWNLREFISISKKRKQASSPFMIRHQMDSRYFKPNEIISKKEKEIWVEMKKKSRKT